MTHCPACDPTHRLDAEAARIAFRVRHLVAVVTCMRAEGRALPDSRAGSRVTSPVPGAGQTFGAPATTAGVQRGGGAPVAGTAVPSADSLRPAADPDARAGTIPPPR